MKKNQVYSKLTGLLVVMLLCFVNASAQNWFHFKEPQQILTSSPDAWIYKIPVDSVYAKAYLQRDVDPNEYWLQKPYALIEADKIYYVPKQVSESGYYFIVWAADSVVKTDVVRKPAFKVLISELGKDFYIDVRDTNSNIITDAILKLSGKPILYNSEIRGYSVPATDNALLSINVGADISFYDCSKKKIVCRQPPQDMQLRQPSSVYKGYLVTNQPTYRIKDTLKYKAYLLDEESNNAIDEPVRVTLFPQYGDAHLIQNCLPAEKAVYYNEFVLGDSLKPGQYDLLLRGEKTGKTISRFFTLEDYLLDETILQVKTEGLPLYQRGDSIHIYAYAATANGLPVLDGKLEIYVSSHHPGYYKPDSLYYYATEVSPEGETQLIVPTAGLGGHSASLYCHIKLTNSNSETKDTIIVVQYSNTPYYIRIDRQGDSLIAHAIKNKKSTPGIKGAFSNDNHLWVPITYPHIYTVGDFDVHAAYRIYNDTNGIVSYQNQHLSQDKVEAYSDFVNDSAQLQVLNPYRKKLRYTIFSGNRFLYEGTIYGDTILKVRQRKQRDMTVLINYIVAGQMQRKRFEIRRPGRQILIDMKKKDIVYPGQHDEISISLKALNGRPVGHTNLTVLAFNTQFKEDNVPVLVPNAVLHKGMESDKFDKYISAKHYNAHRDFPAVREWLKKCGADTLFFYDKLMLPRLGIAAYSFELADKEAPPQLAVYVKEGNRFVRPAYVKTGYYPAYIGIADAGADINALPITDYVYDGLVVRTSKYKYTVRGPRLPGKSKTAIFIDGDSIMYRNPADTLLRAVREPIADTLLAEEQKMLETYLLQYSGAGGSTAYFYQYNPEYQVYACCEDKGLPAIYGSRQSFKLIGPLHNYADVLFVYPGIAETRFRFEPGYITSPGKNIVRQEKNNISDVLRNPLSDYSLWPVLNKMLVKKTVLRNMYTFSPMQKGATQKAQMLIYSFQGIKVEQFHYNANVLLPDLPNGVKYVATHEKSTGRVMLFSRAPILYLPDGEYDVLIMTHAQQFMTSHVSVSGRTQTRMALKELKAFDEGACPDWLQPYLCIRARYEKDNRTYTNNGYSGHVNGSIVNEDYRSLQGVVLELLENDELIAIAQTREDGAFFMRSSAMGRFDLRISRPGYEDVLLLGIIPSQYDDARLEIMLNGTGATSRIIADNYRQHSVHSYRQPLIDKYNPGSSTTLTSDQIEKMPTRSTNGLAATSAGVQQISNSQLSILGSRTEGTLYYIDGVQVRGGANNMTQGTIDRMIRPGTAGAYEDEDGSGDRSRAGIAAGSKKLMKSGKMNDFMNSFMQNASQFSGMRSDFRDWAIWQPNLWTDKDGKTSFSVTYPHNITSWKTYVLAMNKDGYAGRSFHLTRAFKPLAAELSAPRFMRYGDTAYIIGKVMNYTGNAYTVRTAFLYDTTLAYTDSAAVHNAWVKQLQSPAPAKNSRDTASVTLNFSMQTKDGYMDGEERTLPVYPVGTIESKGSFTAITGDTAFSSMADTSQYYTGNTRIHIDGNLIEVMLREIENLKLYPHGCTEQLTTKLIAIYYEEEVKNLLGNNKLNNTEAKRKILEKLISAQNKNGSFGWFSGNSADYRITNYVISTMQKVNKDGWLDVIIRRGLAHLNDNLGHMRYEDRIASLATLSASGYASNYRIHLTELQEKTVGAYNKAVLVKIAKEQGLPYRAALDTLMQQRTDTRHGVYWGQHSYDWYRNDLATTLLMYQVVNGDSVYDSMKQDIINYLLYKRNTGYYANTAESGLILTTLLPQLLKNNKGGIKRSTEVVIAGKINDTIRSFPYTRELRDNYSPLHFTKQGISPVYISVSYDYLNIAPQTHDGTFKVRTFFMRDKDTLTTLKQGDRLIIRTVVDCSKEADYVMVEVPIPAGCVQNLKGNNRNYLESGRENYRDRTAIYCGRLYKGTYTFDVPVEARYKGSYNISPARAQMMYYADEYGHTEVKKVQIR